MGVSPGDRPGLPCPAVTRPFLALALGLALVLPAATARAQGEAEAPPKVAVVTVGDADAALREAAHEVDRALRADPLLLTPADPDLRRALRGESPPDEGDDGLERARRTRRALGMGEARDAAGLTALGRMSGAVAVVAVRRRDGAIEAVVYDVGRAAFFDGALRLPEAGGEEIAHFVGERARVAARAAASAEVALGERASNPTDAEPQDRSQGGRTPVPPRSALRDDPPREEEEEESSWLEDGWPLIVAGILLAGALVYFLVPESPAASGPPVLRFTPGGD